MLKGFTFIYIKRKCVQGVAFEKITFEKCTIYFYFENGKVGVKNTIANL